MTSVLGFLHFISSEMRALKCLNCHFGWTICLFVCLFLTCPSDANDLERQIGGKIFIQRDKAEKESELCVMFSLVYFLLQEDIMYVSGLRF